MRKMIHFFLFPLIWLFGCNQTSTQFLKQSDIVFLPALEESTKGPCYDPASYHTDSLYADHTPLRTIRINFHFMNSSDGQSNFTEEKGRKWAKSLFYSANGMLRKNKAAKLPEGNDIPVLPTRLRLKLTGRPNHPNDDGIYFHYDDKCCHSVKKGKNSTLYSKDMFKEYGIQKDTVLNVFFSSHHPDSIKSKKYEAHLGGVALGSFIKMMWNFGPDSDVKAWEAASTFNHEVGHILGLVHAWGYNDGCDDTPRHNRKKKSSNIMDYNSTQQNWTPCQIGKSHLRLSTLGSRPRKFLIKDWCKVVDYKNIYVKDSVRWRGQKDLISHVYVQNGGTLQIDCRVALPNYAKIVVEPGGKLILNEFAHLHNDCGGEWQGIEVIKKGNRKGIVEIIGSPKLENMQNPLDLTN